MLQRGTGRSRQGFGSSGRDTMRGTRSADDSITGGGRPMLNTDFVFSPGKLTVALDGGAGSSGKGKLGSFLCEHAGNWQFACNTFMPQAAHTVKLDDDTELLYQTFNSCARMTDRYEK